MNDVIQPTRIADNEHPLTVLISCAGRRVELLELFREASRKLGYPSRIIVTDGADERLVSAAAFADQFIKMPSINDPSYEATFIEVVRAENVDLVIPTIDTELEILSRLEPRLKEQGCSVAVSSIDTISICRDKALTMEALGNGGVQVPRTREKNTFDPDDPVWHYPLICKPRQGSSSIGIREFKTPDEARDNPLNADDIVQEKHKGPEYTVNIFVENGALMYAVPHARIATRGGEVNKGVTKRLSVLQELSHKVAAALPGAWGPLCFQAILDERIGPSVFEINARFGGGYPLANRAGADGPERLLRHVAGMPSAPPVTDWIDGLTMLRYDASIFIEACTEQ